MRSGTSRPYHAATRSSDMNARTIMAIDDLRKIVRHDPVTGKVYWLDRADCTPNVRARIANKEALINTSANGYKRGEIRGVSLLAHRVIWALEHGDWPDEVDHINGDRSDNRISNLRAVDRAQNGKNLSLQARSKSGRIGVTWYAAYQKWVAGIVVNRKQFHLGYFATIEEAAAARAEAEARFGFHKNHGRRA